MDKMKIDKQKDGKDDQMYIRIMEYYKHHARRYMPRNKSVRFLQAAQKLRREGDVSNDAVLCGCYI